MTKERAYKYCRELTENLGLENRKVVLAWKAYEEGKYMTCSFLHGCWRAKNHIPYEP